MIRRTRPAEELAAALDGRAPVASDLAVAPLLALAQQLQALPLGPRPEFRDALRSRLLAVSAVSVPADTARSPRERAGEWIEGWRVQRSIAAASAGMAAVVGIAGVGIAGSRSLPGDPFYALKRGAEGVQLTLARGELDKGTQLLQHAETRLDEVGRLVGTDIALAASGPATGTVALGGSRSERVISALEDMDRATTKGTRLLTSAYEETREPEPLKVLASFAERQKRNMAEIAPALPEATREAAEESLRLIAEVEMRANALLSNGVCGDECDPAKPTPPDAAATPQPEPQPTPSTDGLGPRPCDCASPEPTPTPSTSAPTTPPTAAPTSEPTPSEPTPSPSEPTDPTPTDDPSHLPTPLPEPLNEPVEEVLDEVEELLPTPLPSPPVAPAADVAAPPVPGVAKP